MRDVRIVDGAVVTADGYGQRSEAGEPVVAGARLNQRAATTEPVTAGGLALVDAAKRYLAQAMHPLQCRANRYVMTGGLTDGSVCDCGLSAARWLIGTLDPTSTPDAPVGLDAMRAAETAGGGE